MLIVDVLVTIFLSCLSVNIYPTVLTVVDQCADITLTCADGVTC